MTNPKRIANRTLNIGYTREVGYSVSLPFGELREVECKYADVNKPTWEPNPTPSKPYTVDTGGAADADSDPLARTGFLIGLALGALGGAIGVIVWAAAVL